MTVMMVTVMMVVVMVVTMVMMARRLGVPRATQQDRK